jgi:hypothetical protein
VLLAEESLLIVDHRCVEYLELVPISFVQLRAMRVLDEREAWEEIVQLQRRQLLW